MQQEELSDQLFDRFREMIYRIAGISIPDTKRVMLSNRLNRRVKATGAPSYAAYYDRVAAGKDRVEINRFLDAITTRETYFFRDPQHYRWLAESMVPELIERDRQGPGTRRLAIWSAACSGGEELFSALIRLAEARLPPSNWDLLALGTDISEAAVEAAREGTFVERSLRAVSPEERARWFTFEAASARWRIAEGLRGRATFRTHNLLTPMRGGPFDCIFLKNVLIYFDPESKQRVVQQIINALAPGGYLVLGPTEGVHGMLESLRRVEGWLYQRPDGE